MTHEPVMHGWRKAKIGDIAEVVGGTTPSRSRKEYYGGNIPWVTPTEVAGLKGRYIYVSREYITEEAVRAFGLRVLPPNSLLVTSRATIGKSLSQGFRLPRTRGSKASSRGVAPRHCGFTTTCNMKSRSWSDCRQAARSGSSPVKV